MFCILRDEYFRAAALESCGFRVAYSAAPTTLGRFLLEQNGKPMMMDNTSFIWSCLVSCLVKKLSLRSHLRRNHKNSWLLYAILIQRAIRSKVEAQYC